MAVITDATYKNMSPALGVTKLIVDSGSQADAADTIQVTLGSYGITNLLGLTEYIHTTDRSVIDRPGFTQGIANGSSTSAVSSGLLTITIGSGTNVRHVYEVLGE